MGGGGVGSAGRSCSPCAGGVGRVTPEPSGQDRALGHSCALEKSLEWLAELGRARVQQQVLEAPLPGPAEPGKFLNVNVQCLHGPRVRDQGTQQEHTPVSWIWI